MQFLHSKLFGRFDCGLREADGVGDGDGNLVKRTNSFPVFVPASVGEIKGELDEVGLSVGDVLGVGLDGVVDVGVGDVAKTKEIVMKAIKT